MSSSATGRGPGDFPWPDLPGTGRRARPALEDTEAALRGSAARLRACGQEDQARRAERSAAQARFDLDEPLVAGQLHAAAAGLWHIPRVEPLAGQMDRPGNPRGCETWEDAGSWWHSGSIRRSCVSAR